MDLIEKAVSRLDRNDTTRYAPPARHEDRAARAVEPPAARQPAPQRPRESDHADVARRITLNKEKFQANNMIVPDGSRSRVKEEYRNIKQPVLLNAAGRGAVVNPLSNLVMVTSSVPGEGKTFTAINLAMSIASERDKTVLLVDADVLRVNLSSFFDVQKERGLVDYLIDDGLALSDITIGTDIPSLALLPAGSTHHLSTELLSSVSMSSLVLELSRRYPERIVIFDSPPLLHTSEARVLAHQMGQIIMVVEAESTPRGQVQEAYDLLRDISPDTSVSLVLNKSSKSRDWSYYYGYGYGYY